MKLELKQIAAYPNLKCYSLVNNEVFDVEYIDFKKGHIGRHAEYPHEEEDCVLCHNTDQLKPILRPLSDMYKEGIIVVYENILDAPYYVIQDLIKGHFDVFGLIEKGLAIDINTLNTK